MSEHTYLVYYFSNMQYVLQKNVLNAILILRKMFIDALSTNLPQIYLPL
jgi:hypothetical protein